MRQPRSALTVCTLAMGRHYSVECRVDVHRPGYGVAHFNLVEWGFRHVEPQASVGTAPAQGDELGVLGDGRHRVEVEKIRDYVDFACSQCKYLHCGVGNNYELDLVQVHREPVVGVALEHCALVSREALERKRAGSYGMPCESVFAQLLNGLAWNDSDAGDPVGVGHQERIWNRGLDLHRVAVQRLHALDLAKGECGADFEEALDRVHNVVRRDLALRALFEDLIAVLEVHALAEMEDPRVGIGRLPLLSQVRPGFEVVLADDDEGIEYEPADVGLVVGSSLVRVKLLDRRCGNLQCAALDWCCRKD
ncbi:MAG: hypothetical protein BWY92_01815 [Firmicutes bacterium ADurb.BinA052]|nr:MAG: hypothetical protein BWY92_01815 [Firmicutes bacterium ADurb.BinA052]